MVTSGSCCYWEHSRDSGELAGSYLSLAMVPSLLKNIINTIKVRNGKVKDWSPTRHGQPLNHGKYWILECQLRHPPP